VTTDPAGVVVCVAPNPSVDKLFAVDALSPGDLHRPNHFVQVPGGKGLNVARALRALGGRPVAVPILRGGTGRWVNDELEALGIPTYAVWGGGETRSALSVLSEATGQLTEFYESGPPVDDATWGAFEATVGRQSHGAGWVVISGSLPDGAPGGAVGGLVAAARSAGAAVAIDVAGAHLAGGLDATPSLVKVNAAEAGAVLKRSIDGEIEALAAAFELRSRAGASATAIVTMGSLGAVMVDGDGTAWRGRLHQTGPYSVGCGDAFLAGLLHGVSTGARSEAAFAVALGAAAANAEVPGAGTFDGARAHALAGQAMITPLPV
jgi:1-phosphofructokinase family hexose kinase